MVILIQLVVAKPCVYLQAGLGWYKSTSALACGRVLAGVEGSLPCVSAAYNCSGWVGAVGKSQPCLECKKE